MNKKIILSSGGTGGHILPTIGLADYLINKGYKIKVVTDIRGKKYIEENSNLELYILYTDTPFGKNYLKNIYSYMKIIISIFKSLFFLLKEKPNLVIGLGGYVSFPICIAAKFLNISLVVYESNTVLGRTNSYLLSCAKKILIANETIYNFPEKYKNKIEVTDHILRKNISKYTISNFEKENHNFSILILGGSQGAEIFGNIVPEVIKKICELGYKIKIYHQCVESQVKIIKNFYEKNKINNNVFIFSENIMEFMLNADMAISRSGASTTAELIYTNTPFIAVPYPHAVDNHQFYNAKYYKEKGYCWMIEQNNFKKEILFSLLLEILKDTKKIEDIRENMKKKDITSANQKIENIIRKLL